MIEVKFYIGDSLDSCYKMLKERSKEENDVCFGKFNDHEIYSTETLDEVYLKVVGKTKTEFDKEMADWRENYRKSEEEHKAKIPGLTEKYRKDARGLILEEKYNEWDAIVPVRLGDLYHGMELEETLEACRVMRDASLTYDERLRKAYKHFMDAGHSGMSASLVASMIRAFCPDGEDLSDAVMNFRFEKKEEEPKEEEKKK